MTVLRFLQRPEHSFGKPAVFVSLASFSVCFFFLSVRLSDLSFLPPLPRLGDTESLHFELPCVCVVLPRL